MEHYGIIVTLLFIFFILLMNAYWYRIVVSNNIKLTPVYKLFLSHTSTKQMTLEELHTKIWKEIELLQEKGNCEEKKILHCENIGSYAGLGSMMMRYGACMQVAYASGRMFFIHQGEYAHFGGLFRFLKDESSSCGYLKNNYSKMSSCNLHDRNCYLENGYDFNNTYKVVFYNTKNKYPAPRTIPGSLPQEVEKILNSHRVVNPWLWFASQFLGYLMLRLQPETEKLVKEFKMGMNFSYPYTALHIRHGKDKIGYESKFIKNKKYLDWIDRYFDKFLPNEKIKRIYTASDDRDIVHQLQEIKPGYIYMHLPKNYTESILPKYKSKKDTLIYNRGLFPKEVIESIIIEQNFMAYANYTVCFLSSNVCRLQWSLKLATPPYRHENRIISVDGHDLGMYWWFGYIAPFKDFWFPIKDSSHKITFPDGIKMMEYSRGDLLKLHGRIKLMRVNNFVYKVRMGWSVNRPHKALSGYVLISDINNWPGRPYYHFYD